MPIDPTDPSTWGEASEYDWTQPPVILWTGEGDEEQSPEDPWPPETWNPTDPSTWTLPPELPGAPALPPQAPPPNVPNSPNSAPPVTSPDFCGWARANCQDPVMAQFYRQPCDIAMRTCTDETPESPYGPKTTQDDDDNKKIAILGAAAAVGVVAGAVIVAMLKKR